MLHIFLMDSGRQCVNVRHYMIIIEYNKGPKARLEMKLSVWIGRCLFHTLKQRKETESPNSTGMSQNHTTPS